MKLGSIVGAALVSSFMIVVACGESDEEKVAAAAKADEAAQQEQFLDTYCQIVLECCNLELGTAKDVPTCKTHLRAMDPITIANKAARESCLTQSKAEAPDPHFCPDFQHARNPACPDPSRGKQAGGGGDAGTKLGEICNKAEDCAPDFTGVVDCASGICQLRKRGDVGDTCDTTIDGDVVTKLNEASTEATVFTCYYDGGEGTQCDLKSKKCVKPVAAGEACSYGGTECAKGTFCDKEEEKCFAKLAKNSVCKEDVECKGHCEIEDASGGDDDDDVVPTGFCVDAVDVDDDCGTNAWCKDGLECNSGKCTAPGPDARLGSTCTP